MSISHVFYYYMRATAKDEALCSQVVSLILRNAISLEDLEGISSHLAQTSSWTQGWTNLNLVLGLQQNINGAHCGIQNHTEL